MASAAQKRQHARLAAAARACKGTGKIGGAKRTACLRKYLRARRGSRMMFIHEE
jgi:hypothetical protein